MTSIEDVRLISKLIAYGVKKEKVKTRTGYFELILPKNPLSIFFAIENAITFIGTSQQEIEAKLCTINLNQGFLQPIKSY